MVESIFIVGCFAVIHIICLLLYFRGNAQSKLIIELIQKQCDLRESVYREIAVNTLDIKEQIEILDKKIDLQRSHIDDRINKFEHNYKVFIGMEKFHSEDLRKLSDELDEQLNSMREKKPK